MDQGHPKLGAAFRPARSSTEAPAGGLPPRLRTVVVPPEAAPSPAPPGLRRVRAWRLWTMDWYVAWSFLAAYAVCAVCFTGLYVAVEAFTKVQRFIPAGESSPIAIAAGFFVNLAQYHMAMVPTIYVNYMGPILTLSAAMFSLTFLNRGNEFVPLKAAGVSLYRVLAPIFLLAVLLAGWSVFLQEWAIPRLREPIRRALAISRSGFVRPRPFYDPQYRLDVQVKRYSPDLKVAESVTIKRWNLAGTAPADGTAGAAAGLAADDANRVIDAERMIWVPDPGSEGSRQERGRWLLRIGSIQSWQPRWRGEPIPRQDEHNVVQLSQKFDELELTTSLLPIDLETSDQDISYLSWSELKAQSRRQPYHRHLYTRLHHHFAFPLSHVILLLLGVPFVLGSATRSFFLSLVVSFLLCASYFLVSSMSLSLASNAGEHSILPVVASWLPNILFGSLGLTIFTNMRT